ncbi:predicted protein [Naegleria gruberi]|uniref:Predicted protein n=1 Tax=Naegleria gruberi TaxID=5762 RepID=D2VBJ6_NAEGR|nr:uncharacterized protein NAEGRDRAFT_66240 [Naegleria gruberi]EFC45918.1 predicted protein [Naegleria gruberi]|eukprot:XP_002678662.1 predicted protein [Naegleria gruberi strain NEG-M]
MKKGVVSHFASNVQEAFRQTYFNVSKLIEQTNGPHNKVPVLLNELQRFNATLAEYNQRFKHQKQTVKMEDQLFPKINFYRMSLFSYQLGLYTTELMKLSCMNPPKEARKKFNASIPVHQALLLQNQMINMFLQNQTFYRFELLGNYSDDISIIMEKNKEFSSSIDPLFKDTILSSYFKGINLFDLYFRYCETLYQEGVYKSCLVAYQRCIQESREVEGKFYSTPEEIWQLKVMQAMCFYKIGLIHTRQQGKFEILGKEPLDDALKYWFDQAHNALPEQTFEEMDKITGYHFLLYSELDRELPKLLG